MRSLRLISIILAVNGAILFACATALLCVMPWLSITKYHRPLHVMLSGQP